MSINDKNFENFEELTKGLFEFWKDAQPFTSEKTIFAYCRMFKKFASSKYDEEKASLTVNAHTFMMLDKIQIDHYLKKIENKNTRSTYISMFCCLFKHNLFNIPNADELHTHYCDMLTDIKAEIQTKLDEHIKTEVQSKNWRTLGEIRKAIRSRKKFLDEINAWEGESFNKESFRMNQSHLITELYMGYDEHPPVRCNYCMRYIEDQAPFPYLDRVHNYLVKTDEDEYRFIFNKFKTQKHYGTQIIPVCRDLSFTLKKWIDYLRVLGLHKDDQINYLLYNTRKGKLSENMLATYIPEAFSICKAKLTVDTLRHIFISDKCNLGNSKHYAKLMHHSSMEQMSYWKKD